MNPKLFFYFMALIILQGCAPKIEVDPALQPYYSRFIDRSAVYGQDHSKDDITLKFVDSLPEDQNTIILGQCIPDEDLVEINKKYWNFEPTAMRETLIFHELGHCLLERGHTDGVDTASGLQLSMMNSFILPENTFKTKYDYYVSELFLIPKNFDLAALRTNVSNYIPISAAAVDGEDGPEESEDFFAEMEKKFPGYKFVVD